MTLQGAIQELYNMRNDENFTFYYKPVIDKVIETLEMDAKEVRHGRWEKTGTKRYYNNNDMVYVDFELKCSCCGKLKWMSQQQQSLDNYCPNCGAKMVNK